MTSAESKNELTNQDNGRWLVTTRAGSTYLVDLEQHLIGRISGPERTIPLPCDTEQRLRSLDRCRVGEPAKWTCRNFGGYLDPDTLWQVTSPVTSITRAKDEDG